MDATPKSEPEEALREFSMRPIMYEPFICIIYVRAIWVLSRESRTVILLSLSISKQYPGKWGRIVSCTT